MAKRIYVADDELHIRTLIQTFLVNEGYEVETFEDGKSLFEAFKKIADDRESMKKIALEGQKYAYNTFNIDENINNILEVYDEVLHRRS